MHAAAHLVKEWAFVVNAENFRFRLSGLELAGDVMRNSFDAATGVVGAGGFGGGGKKRCAGGRPPLCPPGISLVWAFHSGVGPGGLGVEAAGAGECGLSALGEFPRARRGAQALA